MALNNYVGSFSFMLANMRSQPLAWQTYLSARQSYFFFTDSYWFAKTSNLVPITMMGTSEEFILLRSSCFSHFSSTRSFSASNYYGGFNFEISSKAFCVCSQMTLSQ